MDAKDLFEDGWLVDFLLEFEQIRHLTLLWLASSRELKSVTIEASLKLFLDLLVPLQFFYRLLCHDLVTYILSYPRKGRLKHE